MKCIFVKNHREAIKDFELVKSKNKNGVIMDHSYDFYIGLSYLQLNQLQKAEEYLKNSIDYSEKHWKAAHFNEYFYLGIIKMEQENLIEANQLFDKVIGIYKEFPDALYYKALLLEQQNKYLEAKQIIEQAIMNMTKGYSINEDNAKYEDYPYQIKRDWLTYELEIINKKLG